MDKKIYIIIILSLIIAGLVWFVFARNGQFETAIDQIREQRISALRSTAIVEFENSKIRIESAGLRENNIQSEENYIQLETENKYYRKIIGEFTAGDKENKKYLGEYGRINYDLASFIQQNSVLE